MDHKENRFLEKELSYKLCGLFIGISKKYGYLYKEKFYHNILNEVLESNNINYISEPKINIYSPESNKVMATYIPDILAEEKIIIEIKALPFMPKELINQLDQYLKASKYEIGYLINFGKAKAEITRRIYTNDRKPWLSVSHL